MYVRRLSWFRMIDMKFTAAFVSRRLLMRLMLSITSPEISQLHCKHDCGERICTDAVVFEANDNVRLDNAAPECRSENARPTDLDRSLYSFIFAQTHTCLYFNK